MAIVRRSTLQEALKLGVHEEFQDAEAENARFLGDASLLRTIQRIGII
jgi:hypothetical protein